MAEEIVLSDHNVPRIPLQDELTRLYSQGFLTDITLSTEDGKNFEAHKILLAARSTYFHSVVPRLKSDPVIFLKGVKGAHLDKILKFIYSGKVALSRHQLKPILEVAKSLQVAGLCDANPTDILQQQQPSALGNARIANLQAAAAAANSSGGSGGSPHVLQRQVPPSGGVEKRHSSPASSSTSTSMGSPGGGTGGSFKTPQASKAVKSAGTAKSPYKGGAVANGGGDYEAISDSDDKDADSDDDEVGDGSGPGKAGSKRKRGRPPKAPSGGPKSKSDPYDFENEESGSTDTEKKGQSSAKKLKAAGLDSEDDGSGVDGGAAGDSVNADEGANQAAASGEGGAQATGNSGNSSNAQKRSSSKYATSSINGKQVLEVKCNEQNAELHLSRFANGIRGKSIMYKDEWMTPQEFELACGSTGKRYLENIQTDYGPLKTLTNSGLLKPHSRKCRCSICRGDSTEPKGASSSGTPIKNKAREEISTGSQQSGDGGSEYPNLSSGETADPAASLATPPTTNTSTVSASAPAIETQDFYVPSTLTATNIKQEMNDDLDFLNNGSGSEEIRAPGFPSASPLNKSGQSDFKGTGVKRKKKKHKNSNEWRKQLNEKVAQANINMNAMNATASEIIQHGMNTAALVTTGGPAGPGGALTNGGPLMLTGPPGTVTDVEEVQALTGPGAQPGGQTVLTYTSVYEQAMQPTKINEVAGPPLAQPPTFYVMSPHPNQAGGPPPGTPQHNPFSNSMVTLPSPSPALLSPAPALTPALMAAPPPPTPPTLIAATPQHMTEMPPIPDHLQLQPPPSPMMATSGILTSTAATVAVMTPPPPMTYTMTSSSSTSSTSVTAALTSAGASSSAPSAVTTTVAAAGGGVGGLSALTTEGVSDTSSDSDTDSDDDSDSGAGSKGGKSGSTTLTTATIKFGSVMNVRCKSTTALLYACKYETGSKGKCINLGNEWLTPNEFEDRAGSKAKKYLSSIKCMGRPLRVYVNSGELKGTGPPPTPKPKKIVPVNPNGALGTPKPVQPIAPAPPPAPQPQQQQQHLVPPPPAVTPIPITIAAPPPTPTHISSAPPIPANLMGPGSGPIQVLGPNGPQPILINTSMPNTIVTGTANSQPGSIFTLPQTFTIPMGQPIEVRQQNQGI